MTTLVSILYWFVIIIFLIIYGLIITIVWAVTVPFDKKRKIISYTTHIHAMVFFWLAPGWRIKIEGKENLEKGKHYVITTNHQAMFDILLLHALKFNVRWIAKRELMKMPFVGHAMFIHGDVRIDRGDSRSALKMMKQCKDILNKGVSISMFPEGTRTKTGRLGNFKDGAFIMAKDSGVGILPIVIDGTANAFDVWKLKIPHTFTIKVLPAISPEIVSNTDVKELKAMTREMILENHMVMRPDLYKDK